MQINHAGSAATQEITGTDVVGPSAVCNPSKANSVVPRELAQDDICNIVEQFAQAAKRAKAASFDGVEIHSCHGYLLDQFLSPLTNRRTDEYGGNIMNRILIHLKVIEAIRLAVGDAFPCYSALAQPIIWTAVCPSRTAFWQPRRLNGQGLIFWTSQEECAASQLRALI